LEGKKEFVCLVASRILPGWARGKALGQIIFVGSRQGKTERREVDFRSEGEKEKDAGVPARR